MRGRISWRREEDEKVEMESLEGDLEGVVKEVQEGI